MGFDYLDAQTVWENMPGVEPVTFTSVALSGNTPFSLYTAKRRKLNFKEVAASNGVYTSQNQMWLLSQRQLLSVGVAGTHFPKPADIITDGDSTAWTILSAEQRTLKQTWECVVISLVLAYDLRQLVTIFAPLNTFDPALSRIATPEPVYTHVPARIQDESGEESLQRGKKLIDQHLTVYLGQRVVIGDGYTVQDEASGKVYEVVSYEAPDRLDQLMQLHVEERGW